MIPALKCTKNIGPSSKSQNRWSHLIYIIKVFLKFRKIITKSNFLKANGVPCSDHTQGRARTWYPSNVIYPHSAYLSDGGRVGANTEGWVRWPRGGCDGWGWSGGGGVGLIAEGYGSDGRGVGPMAEWWVWWQRGGSDSGGTCPIAEGQVLWRSTDICT